MTNVEEIAITVKGLLYSEEVKPNVPYAEANRIYRLFQRDYHEIYIKNILKEKELTYTNDYNLGLSYCDNQQYNINWEIIYVEYKNIFTSDICKFYSKEFKKIKSVVKNAECTVYISEDHRIVADI